MIKIFPFGKYIKDFIYFSSYMSDKKQIPDVAFSKSFRGYDVSEVNEYVQNVNAYEVSVQHTIEKLESKVGDLETEIQRLRELESSLFRAIKMAEEAQENWKIKMAQEAEEQKINTQKHSKKIIEDATKEAEKIKFLAESEKKQLLMGASQELKEQERGLKTLKEAQREIARQLSSVANLTLGQLSSWEVLKNEEKEVLPIEKPAKEKLLVKKAIAVKKSKSVPNAKEKSDLTKINQAKPSSKKSVSPKRKLTNSDLSASSHVDDGLPTLNKVLAAYAKSTGPKGKIGDIN
jgi:cell division initiation protein